MRRDIMLSSKQKHVGPTTPTQTTPKSAKSSAKQPLHKSSIHLPKSIKDRLKNLSPIKLKWGYPHGVIVKVLDCGILVH